MTRSPTKIPTLLAAVAAATLLCAAPARADGLADLRAALGRLQAQTPVKATLDVRTVARHGEGKELDERIGQASVLLEDGARGLQVTYSRDTLARMDAEARQRGRDPKAKTPTVWALAELDSNALVPMTSAVTALAKALDESVFKAERPEPWGGKPARLLTFTIPLERLSEQQRKYVKQFDGELDVWIGADGTPLASTSRVSVKGRAFVVISFEAHDDEDSTYGVVGDRLLTLRRETHNVSSGAGERGEERVVRTLQPQS
jgi:hypothetical protein